MQNDPGPWLAVGAPEDSDAFRFSTKPIFVIAQFKPREGYSQNELDYVK